jgi:hypothetical protein
MADRRKRHRPELSKAATKLARQRLAVKYRQSDMSRLTGIPLATYRKLERGEQPNPPLRHVVNC